MAELIDIIRDRRSIRRFAAEPMKDQDIDAMLDCARLAPTARNNQPWLVSAVTDPDLLALIANSTDHGKFIKDAACCFAVFCQADEKYYLEDGCAATMNIILSAESLGLGTCWVAGDKKSYADDIRTILNVEPEYSLVSLVACGRPTEERPKPGKKRADKVCFRDRKDG